MNGEALSAIRDYVLQKAPPPHITPNQAQANAIRKIDNAQDKNPLGKGIDPVTRQALDAMRPRKKPPR